ncbi:MAG: hypothetical protein OMM_00555 [Candidatus Magnetoglobus multicellularis str. Araruama]|uniref:Uncharacterized protein n=1 Tax=Candidatus Magnetoglobus multicellularis str. Araruama TaxID=890399 RepID=A0A1V1PGI5_9BACT|nr:MAG: hypothetical protein OMM_00555 [Candidatus Magnetoglobus multicellularis str. Araruama]
MNNRTYRVEVDDDLWHTEGLKVVFNVEKSLIGTPNKADITIYNMAASSRKKIQSQGKKIKLFAGRKGEKPALLFVGKITNLIHQKISTEWVSKFYCYDSIDYLEKQVNLEIEKGATVEDQFNLVLNELQGVYKGFTSGLKKCMSGQVSILRHATYSGSIREFLERLSEQCGFEFFMENETIETIEYNTPIDDIVPITINQSQGMIGSPEITEQGIMVNVLLKPELKLGRKIKVESTSKKVNMGAMHFARPPALDYTGSYIIRKVNHQGDTHSDLWMSRIEGGFLL